MSGFFILFLVFLFSCSSNRPQQTEIPAFVKEKVCSPEALSYQQKQSLVFSSKPAYSNEEVKPYVLKLQPFVKDCHEREMMRTGQLNSYNLCFVVGIDKKGYTEFFQFSTSEIALTLEMKKCLDDIKQKADFGKLKDVTILQPFILYPKK